MKSHDGQCSRGSSTDYMCTCGADEINERDEWLAANDRTIVNLRRTVEEQAGEIARLKARLGMATRFNAGDGWWVFNDAEGWSALYRGVGEIPGADGSGRFSTADAAFAALDEHRARQQAHGDGDL